MLEIPHLKELVDASYNDEIESDEVAIEFIYSHKIELQMKNNEK